MRPAGTAVRSERLREPIFQELSEFRCRLELRDGIQFLERRYKGIRETPDRPRSKFLILRFKVQIMYAPRATSPALRRSSLRPFGS